jgi:hypothetical protein
MERRPTQRAASVNAGSCIGQRSVLHRLGPLRAIFDAAEYF